jgi:ABC-2 type transport system permease protein
MATSISRVEIIAGHALALVVIVLAQQALLVLTGQLAFGVDYAREPLGLVLVMAALALWVAALGLLLGMVARGEDQAVLFSLVAMFVLSALGGAWFPLEVSGPAFAAVGHLLPSAWAMDGFQNLVVRGLGLQSALLPAAVMAGYALVFMGVAVWRFRGE